MKFISVDYQGDFAANGGRWYRERPCESFITNELIPFFRSKKIRLSEIVSDYRLPRPSETLEYCLPGTMGFSSFLPADIKTDNTWIKCMNSPVWIRENAGVPDGKPGQPYSAPDKFSEWLLQEIGTPEFAGDVVLFGLTLDCCVLCLAQELYFRGYTAHILYEAVDTYMGSKEQKDNMFDTPLPMWAKKITWAEVKEKLGK